MHVSGNEENFKLFIALVLKLLIKNIGNLFVRLLVISLLTFRNCPQLYPFSEPEPPRVFTAPAPAPAPSKPFRRLRLRLRLRPKYVGSGGSGSGSGSGSASLVLISTRTLSGVDIRCRLIRPVKAAAVTGGITGDHGEITG